MSTVDAIHNGVMHTHDLKTISASAQQCVSLYKHIFASLNKAGALDLLEPSHCSDELGRFRIWANNIGALRNAESVASVDSRLKHAPGIKASVLEMLDDLTDDLQNVLEITTGQRISRQEDVGQMTSISELDELFASAKDCVTSLMKVSIAIRMATTRDRYLKAESSNAAPLLSDWDISHVAQKYPKLERSPWLQKRLGTAITKRRQFLRYCEDHHSNLGPSPLDDTGTIKESSKASTLHLETIEQLRLEVLSQASAATSYAFDESDESSLRPPRLADVASTFPFKCPLCQLLLDLTTEQAWRNHLFRDLRPYVCTFEQCDLKLFESRHAWFDHELENHRLLWVCRACNHNSFSAKTSFILHMRGHLPTTNQEQLGQIAKASCRPAQNFAKECPLCDWEEVSGHENADSDSQSTPNVSLRQIRRHIGRHMEQLALFALPKSLTQVDDGSSASERASNGGKLVHEIDEPELSSELRSTDVVSKRSTMSPKSVNDADSLGTRLEPAPSLDPDFSERPKYESSPSVGSLEGSQVESEDRHHAEELFRSLRTPAHHPDSEVGPTGEIETEDMNRRKLSTGVEPSTSSGGPSKTQKKKKKRRHSDSSVSTVYDASGPFSTFYEPPDRKNMSEFGDAEFSERSQGPV